MAINVMVAIGGTGARVAEAYVYAAASGLLHGNEKTLIYVVDKDIDCGNTTRLMKTIDEYRAMRECTGLDLPEIEHCSWLIETAMVELDPSLEKGGSATFRQVACTPGTGDELLANLMHSKEEQNLDLKKGFYGHPSLGAALYGLITETDTFHSAANTLVNSIKNELAGSNVNTFFVGSMFGGTGASLLPNVAQTLQECEEIGRSPLYRQAACLMLPYFKFQPSKGVDTAKVDFSTFDEKTATALSFYDRNNTRMQNAQADLRKRLQSADPNAKLPLTSSYLISTDYKKRNDPQHGLAIFDDVFVFGQKPLESTCRMYSEGGAEQTHTFTVTDFYAALSAVEFFNQATVKVPEGTPHMYTADMPTPCVGWPQVPNAEAQPLIEQMVRFCYAFLMVLYPAFTQNKRELADYEFLKNIYGRTGAWGWGLANLPPDLDFGEEVERIVPFCEKYLRFFIELHNRNYTVAANSVDLFTDFLGWEHDFLMDNNDNIQERQWFRANYNLLRREHFKPDNILIGGRRTAIPDAVALWSRLGKYRVDKTGYRDLQPLYRAVYDIMRVR